VDLMVPFHPLCSEKVVGTERSLKDSLSYNSCSQEYCYSVWLYLEC
jgi:hypothetical protein